MDKIKHFFFRNTTTRQTIVKNTVWIGVSTALIKIARATIIIYAARLIGTQQYGVFTYAMSVAAIFAVVSDMGISSILVRELSKNKEKVKEYFSTALVIKIGFLATTALLIVGITPLFSRFDASTALMPVIALSIVLESLRSFFYSIPRAANNMQTESVINIINELCCIAIIIIVFMRNPSPHTLAYSLMIGNAVGFAVSLISVRHYIVEARKYFVRELVMPLIRLTAPFAILSVFGIFMTNIDSVVIGMFEDEHVLGLYGAAQRPFNILYILPGFLGASLLPLMSRFIKDGNRQMINNIVGTASIASITIALPLIFGGIIVAGPLINVIFGSAYAGAVATFQILLLTLLFVFPGTIFAEVLLAENKQRIFIFTGITGAILNVGLNFTLIPSYGIVGSAIATVIAQAVVNTCFYIEMRKTTKVHIARGLHKTLCAATIMGLLVYCMLIWVWPLLAIILVSALVYAGLLFLMKDTTLLELRRSLR